MKIEKRFLTPNRFSRPARKLIAVKGIVIHWVANPGTSALMNRNYFENLKKQEPTKKNLVYASAHFIVGLNGEIIQCLPLNEWAYHVGAQNYKRQLSRYPNNCTLGIEMCHPDWSGKFCEATLTSTAELTAKLLKQFNLTTDDVYRHFDITGKICPKYFVNNEPAFLFFKEAVKQY